VTRRPRAEVAGSRRAQLGEGPYWDAPRDRLLWVDIAAGHVLAHTPADGDTQVLLDHGDLVSAVLPHADGDLVLGLRDGVGRWNEDGGAPPRLVVPLQADAPDVRCNDASVGPDGSLWIGTMEMSDVASVAALYRVGRDTSRDVEVVRDGLIISNGLGWSPGGRVLHHVDAPTRQIADLHLDVDGRIVSTRVRATIPDGAGFPDGLAVDVDGGICVARRAGGAVWRFTPDGQVDAIVEVAATNVISCAFGGPDLNVLYITTGGPVTCALPTLPNGSSSEAARRPPASDLRDRR
jgi:sugar lactone lactonase YvrE